MFFVAVLEIDHLRTLKLRSIVHPVGKFVQAIILDNFGEQHAGDDVKIA